MTSCCFLLYTGHCTFPVTHDNGEINLGSTSIRTSSCACGSPPCYVQKWCYPSFTHSTQLPVLHHFRNPRPNVHKTCRHHRLQRYLRVTRIFNLNGSLPALSTWPAHLPHPVIEIPLPTILTKVPQKRASPTRRASTQGPISIFTSFAPDDPLPKSTYIPWICLQANPSLAMNGPWEGICNISHLNWPLTIPPTPS